MGAWLTPKNMLLRNVCYQTKFRRSRTNRMGVGKGVPNFFWRTLSPPALGWVGMVALRIMPLRLTVPISLVLG